MSIVSADSQVFAEEASFPPERAAGQSDLLRTGFIIVVAICFGIALLLQKLGYGYVALAVGLTPVLAASLINARVGIYAFAFWQAWDAVVAWGAYGVYGKAWITPAKPFVFLVIARALIGLLNRPIRFHASRNITRWLMAFCAVAFFSLFWSYATVATLRYSLQAIVQLVFLLVMVPLICEDPVHLKRAFFWCVLGGTAASIHMILFGTELAAWHRASLSEQANPVSAAFGLTIAFGCLPVMIVFAKKRSVKLLYVVAGLVMYIGLFYTGTRASIVGIMAAGLLAGLVCAGVKLRRRLLFAVSLLAIGYALGFVIVKMEVLPSRSQTRLANFLMIGEPEPGTSSAESRWEVWEIAFRGYFKTSLVGTGFGATTQANTKLLGVRKDVHSNVVGSLTEMGLPGLITFAGLHVAMLAAIRRVRPVPLRGAALFLLLNSFFAGAFHTSYMSKWFWLPIALLLAVLEYDARAHHGDLEGWPPRYATQLPPEQGWAREQGLA